MVQAANKTEIITGIFTCPRQSNPERIQITDRSHLPLAPRVFGFNLCAWLGSLTGTALCLP